ncbi:hypothetical protein KQX62_03665 [Rhodopseudomonas palustris]|uniref:PASTA domain-containing protein n=1 Tax=Rhodopseudomonas palustris TaxID=1076 RepID=A0AAX3E0B8_RHOPL|nr:hypothetical protein [Rhodopseudomonas palustris]UYO40424.1 hypothetical protein KQX62_03665 [Rhodopseudomonas palustris]
MTQITRTFDSATQAKAAVAELKQRGFNRVELVEVPDRRGPSGGGAVVRVEPPFGSALVASGILERHGGKEAGATSTAGSPAPALAQPARTEAQPAPDSAAQAVKSAPVASPARPAPPQARREELRSGPRTVSEWLGIPLLINSNTFFSGFPLLLRPSRKAPAAKPE